MSLDIVVPVGYLATTWVAAYILRVTAPVACPNGRSASYCKLSHPFHVKRLDATYDLILGLFWPALIVVLVCAGVVKSVEVAAEATPVEKFRRPDKIDPSRMLEAADQEFEKIKRETDQHVREIHEGKIVE